MGSSESSTGRLAGQQSCGCESSDKMKG